MVKKILQFIL